MDASIGRAAAQRARADPAAAWARAPGRARWVEVRGEGVSPTADGRPSAAESEAACLALYGSTIGWRRASAFRRAIA